MLCESYVVIMYLYCSQSLTAYTISVLIVRLYLLLSLIVGSMVEAVDSVFLRKIIS